MSLVGEDPLGVSIKLTLWKESLAVSSLFGQQLTISLTAKEFSSIEEFVNNFVSLTIFEGIGSLDIIKLSLSPGVYSSATIRRLISESRGLESEAGFRIATKEISLNLKSARIDLEDIISSVKVLAKFMIHYHLLRKLTKYERHCKAECNEFFFGIN